MSFLRARATGRFGGAWLFLLLFLAVTMLTRVALLARAAHGVDWNASLLAAFAWGFAFDLGAALLFAIPLVLLLIVLPAGFFRRRWARILAQAGFVVIGGLLLFVAVAEWVYWTEFQLRFNFIAVDYLIYTTEVIGNIRESYPMPAIFAGLALGALGVFALLRWSGLLTLWLDAPPERLRQRAAAGSVWLGAAALLGFGLDAGRLPAFANNYNHELAKNGAWAFVAEFRANEIDWDTNYAKLPVDEAFRTLHTALAVDGGIPLPSDHPDSLRYIRREGPELKLNVVQITVESLSADFLGTFNPASHLTPNLDALAAKSLVFTNLYATGTRTDRGMEALALGVPPTPGRSLVKRLVNDHLFTLGSVFRGRGYDTAFLYSGYGYFDNMNTFFGGNGYRIVDRGTVAKEDITFANAWGACDEDLFRWTLRAADTAFAAGRPFHFFVMTTSNHRPFTYPAGKIDLAPSTTGRAGAVKYTDYAIGQLLKGAASKPWFKNTVFVIVADHCASVAGKAVLPVQNYHIPLFIYAPGGQIAPGRVDALMSQVDYAPTLLGLLNWSYATRFFGTDVIHAPAGRAFVGNYQKLGYLSDQKLGVLSPRRAQDEFTYDPTPPNFALIPREIEPAFMQTEIAYYQTASYLFKHGLYREISPEEDKHFAADAAKITTAKSVAR